MRKPGCNPDHVLMSDVLCDFCLAEWSADRPMVEGHQGSCICGTCLTQAYASVAPREDAAAHQGTGNTEGTRADPVIQCILCLESRAEPAWSSPLRPDVLACRRCVRQSAAVLQKDQDSHWKRPEPVRDGLR